MLERKKVVVAKIGFYGGSFNPPNKAHIELAKKALIECNLDKVIFVPVGDSYQKDEMARGIHRYNMLKIACSREEYFEVSDIEINSKENYKAIDIFEILKNKYKDDRIFFIMGTDNLKNISLWKERDRLISEFNYIILDRGIAKAKNIIENEDVLKKNKDRFKIVSNNKFKDCSSTDIRKQIINGEKPSDLDNNVYNYIKENGIYNMVEVRI